MSDLINYYQERITRIFNKSILEVKDIDNLLDFYGKLGPNPVIKEKTFIDQIKKKKTNPRSRN